MVGGHWYKLQGLPTTCLGSIYLKKINGNYSVNLILVKGLVNPISQAGKKCTLPSSGKTASMQNTRRAEVSLLTTEWQHSTGWQQDGRSMTFLLGLQYCHKRSKTYIDLLASSDMAQKGTLLSRRQGWKHWGTCHKNQNPFNKPKPQLSFR